MASELRAQYLHAMGIDAWRLRSADEVSGSVGEAFAKSATQCPDAAGDDWTALQQQVVTCERCGLHRTRAQTVFGAGHPAADWLIVGAVPGVASDHSGEPFAGPVGQLLDAMLAAIALDRKRVYITNITKCQPPGDRDPQAHEAASCEMYLQKQIRLIRPQLILAAGPVAAQYLLKSDAQFSQLRGQVHHYGTAQIPLIVTHHPAELMRTPKNKRDAWEDLQLAAGAYQRLAQGAAL